MLNFNRAQFHGLYLSEGVCEGVEQGSQAILPQVKAVFQGKPFSPQPVDGTNLTFGGYPPPPKGGCSVLFTSVSPEPRIVPDTWQLKGKCCKLFA